MPLTSQSNSDRASRPGVFSWNWRAALPLAVGFFLAGQLHAQVVTLSGLGTATIDGVIGGAEWSGAGSTLLTNIAKPGGGTTTATVFAMNDATNLYLAVRIDAFHTDPAAGGSAQFAFINSGSGTTFSTGDNNLVLNANIGLFDNYYASAVSPGASDTGDGGTSNGLGAFTTDASNSYYELRFPLNSGDGLHDFNLTSGQSVRFQTSLQLVAIISSVWTSASTTTPGFVQFNVTAIPEPAGCAALLGVAGLAVTLRRRREASRD
jgi:hypothetical protein